MATLRRAPEPDPDLRLRAIKLLSKGISQAEVARQVGVSREAVRQWVARYMQGGIAALAPRPKGRRSRVKADAAAAVLDKMIKDLERFGVMKKRWSIFDAQRAIDEELGVRLSPQRVHALLLKLGYRFIAGLGWRKEIHEKLPPVAPWGFKRDREGKMVPNDEERDITAIVRAAYIDGLTIPEIVAMLKRTRRRGRTGRPIGTTRVFEMIHGAAARREPRGRHERVVKRSSSRIRARSLPAVISRHIESALEGATYVEQDDGSYGAMVPGLRGILATGDTLEQCRSGLAQVVESWRKLVVALERRHGTG